MTELPTAPPAPVSRWKTRVVFALVAVVAVYGMIYAEVVRRAKSCYLKGEMYMAWHEHPEQKRAALDRLFEEEKRALTRDRDKGRFDEAEFRRRMDALEFDRTAQRDESPLKLAYQWYKDAYELFSPPESRWVTLARGKARDAQTLWKEELREKKIPFDENNVD